MKKLISVGCSFTNQHFPTVPDWLGYCFDEYENLGKEGFGNRYIFNQIFNYIQDNDISDTFFTYNGLVFQEEIGWELVKNIKAYFRYV